MLILINFPLKINLNKRLVTKVAKVFSGTPMNFDLWTVITESIRSYENGFGLTHQSQHLTYFFYLPMCTFLCLFVFPYQNILPSVPKNKGQYNNKKSFTCKRSSTKHAFHRSEEKNMPHFAKVLSKTLSLGRNKEVVSKTSSTTNEGKSFEDAAISRVLRIT